MRVIKDIFRERWLFRKPPLKYYRKRKPGKGEKPCPYDDVPYKDVPGYVPGYGCPVCKAISFYHLPVPADS